MRLAISNVVAVLSLIHVFYFQVATALLVTGPTLTLWIPHTQALFKVCQYSGLFQLMHSSSQDAQQLMGYTQDRIY